MKIKWLLLLIGLLLFKPPTAVAKTGHLTSEQLQYKQQQNIYIAVGNVKLDYQQSTVTANKLRMEKEKNLAYFTGNTHLIRDKKETKERIWSQKLKMDLEQDILEASKEVELKTKKEAKPLYLTSNQLKIWTKTDDMLATDDVFVDYDGQKIRGERLDYQANKEKMIVTEQVEIKEEENWIKCQRAVLWLEDNILAAQGKVEMEFEVKENKSQKSGNDKK